MNLIDVKNLKLGYDGKTIVDNVSFSLSAGDYVCVVGENGSGKTTLIKGLLGLVKKYDGDIIYSSELSKSHMGYLSQTPQYTKDFPASVREVVMSGFLNKSFFGFIYSKEHKSEANSIMKKVGVESLSKESFNSLSGGQQQRVLLARALCATKKLLLLDEPTSALDPVVTADFYSLVGTLSREGVAVLMVSHDVNSAVKVASHILHLGSDSYFFGTTHEYLHSEMGKKLLISDCPCDECTHRIGKGVKSNA